ncbi:MAG: 4-oxalocrotonate tautomerase [Frankiales bacterium]|nr:4-oxalocrotonate tautomerase [Frankiales bacterium]
MPLVRIDVIEGRRTPEQLRLLADTVCEDTGRGIPRSDDLVVLQVFQQGRSEEQKRALYAGLAERLQEATGLAAAGLVVSVVANTREDRSFGLGRAQFLDGDL